MDESKPRRHRLTEVDAATRTATCSVCGRTSIHYRSNRASECMTVRRSNRGDSLARNQRLRQDPLYRLAEAEYQREYRAKNPSANIKAHQSLYGWDSSFDHDDYESLLRDQGGACAICRHKPTGRRLAIDHDHQTGRIRGLLCMGCNVVLGRFKDDASRFLAAAQYLSTP